jgi:AcrR family transcriptional regulator
MKHPRVVVVTDRDVKALFAREALKKHESVDVEEVFERVNATMPKQARSLETVNRLLDAAEQLLETEGLDAATVPAIAKRARVSVGVVYRRFPDKDTLLRAVWERFLARKREQTQAIMAGCAHLDQVALPDLVRFVIRATIEAHRKKRNLLRALLRFSRTHPDPEFKRAAHEMNQANTAVIAMLMLQQRDRIEHPNPEAAIHFAIITIASVIQAVILEGDGTHVAGLHAPVNLEEELTRMLFGYLGIEGE